MLAFIVGCVNVWVTLRRSNKNAFIRTITNARKEYLVKLRKQVAEFCAIADSENKDQDKIKLRSLSYQLKTLMNPSEKWDKETIELIDEILQSEDKKTKIDEFLISMQLWFALEWEGMTAESKHGVLSKKRKKKLRESYYSKQKEMRGKEGKTSCADASKEQKDNDK